MYNTLHLTKKVKDLAKELQEYQGLTAYEALDIALKVERNEILERAFVLSDSDSVPSALEKLIHTIEDK